MDLIFEELVVILFVIVLGRFTFKRGQCQGALVENTCGLQVVDELFILLEWTCHLLPCHEFGHLFRELPELFKIYVTGWESNVGGERGKVVG